VTIISSSSSLKRGFTIVELLVVVAVIGILAAAIASIINPIAQFQKAQDSKRKSDLAQIQRALEIYYQDYRSYPNSNGYIIAGIGWGLSWTPYMGTLPTDPSSPSKKYAYVSDGQTYYLYASLDRDTSDLRLCKSGGAKCDNAPVDACGTGKICNYGVSSPNVSP
jgi:general secretion pathway protein G